MQQIFSELWRNLSPEAQNVLKENGLDSYEKMKPWIIGVRKDFPKADTETRHELEDFIIEIREKMHERLATNTNLPEKKEEKLEETKVVETPEQPATDSKEDISAQNEKGAGSDNDDLQKKYKQLLSLDKYIKAKSFSEKKELSEVSKVKRLKNAVREWNYRTKEYLNFLELLDELFHPQNEMSSNDTEFGEEEKKDLDLSQGRYEELLRKNDKAKIFVDNRIDLLGKVEQVRKLWESGSLGEERGKINGPKNPIKTIEYREFYKVVKEFFTGTTDKNEELFVIDDVFVKRYTEKNGHLPMFYILKKYFEITEERNDMIVAQYYGAINDQNLPQRKQELSNKNDITKNQIENVLTKKNISKRLSALINSDNWDKYNIFSKQCIFDIEEDSECREIIDNENVTDTVVAAAFALKGYKIKYLWKVLKTKSKNYKLELDYPQEETEVFTIAIKDKLSGYMFQKVINEFTPTRDIELRRSLIDSETYWTGARKPNDLSEDDYKALEEALKILFRKFLPEINISEDNKILHIEGERDYIEDIVKILTENGNRKPVNAFQLMYRLQNDYPDEEKYKEWTKFKEIVKKNDRQTISLVGKKDGRDALIVMVEWSWWTKGLPKLVEEIIKKANRPVSQGEIEEQISKKLYEYQEDSRKVIDFLRFELGKGEKYKKLQNKIDRADTDTYYILSGSNFDKGMFLEIDD